MFVAAALFTLASAYAAGLLLFPALLLPRVIRLGLGAVVLSLVVFLELLAGCGTLPVFLTTGLLCLAAGAWRYRAVHYPVSPASLRTALWIPFAVYTAIYTIYAMAPETQPDAITYHLGLTAEYARVHGFPARIGFYEMLPQGLEMLFTMAYALGGGSAAKLTHFAFLLATAPLMMAIGRELKLGVTAPYIAALLYFAMPVAAIAGTSTYNDAALVFFTLATFYCLLLWHRARQPYSLIVTGLLAGFCYGIKVTGFPVVAAAVVAVLVLGRSWLPVALITAAALVPMAPWILRAFLLTGNPAAPLLNSWFPNAFFNAASEAFLAATLRSHSGIGWRGATWQYAMGGGMEGMVGPLLFALPLTLAALRKHAGRLLMLAALVALSPWFLNAGTRFFMPAIPFLTLALCLVIPVRMLAVMVALQLVLCWPQVLERFEVQYAWALHDIPWRAALRLEPEAVYLDREIGEYAVARMIETKTGPQDRTLCLTEIAKAYTTRDVHVYWYSTPDQQLMEALETALTHPARVSASAVLPGISVTGLRVVAGAASPEEFRIYELQPFARGVQQPARRMQASPNESEAMGAMDNNSATSWRARAVTERGMFLTALFGQPTALDRVDITLPEALAALPLIVQTQRNPGGTWSTVADSLRTTRLPLTDLRREATRALRSAGFRFILASAGETVIDAIGRDMVKHTAEWGLRDEGEFTPVHLFRIE